MRRIEQHAKAALTVGVGAVKLNSASSTIVLTANKLLKWALLSNGERR